MRRSLTSCLALALLAGCELQETTLAQPEPFVVVEAYLVGGGYRQWVAIHAGGSGSTVEPRLDGALVEIIGPDSTLVLEQTDLVECAAPTAGPGSFPILGCYAVAATGADPEPLIRPGELYRLRVTLVDGSVLVGSTRVPGAFEVDSPFECYLPPWTQRTLAWSESDHAIGYLSELAATGLVEALEAEGYSVSMEEPILIRGLSVGAQDTAIVLPSEFGVFDRFSLDSDLLRALQLGVPPEVDLDITIAAIDQNYVNWARGGDFNPSGVVRVPSVRGPNGTGVFASLTPRFLSATTRADAADLPVCGLP